MKKDLTILLVVIAAAVLLFLNVDIKSVDEYYAQNPLNITEDTKACTISVQCKDILLHLSADGSITEKFDSGIILDKTDIALCENDTVFDVLVRCLKYENISFDFSGNPHSKINPAYIIGIDGLNEFDFGKMSGWQYSVNGVSADKSCDQYELNDGDTVEFYYVCDYTEVEK